MAITFAEREAAKYPDLAPVYNRLAGFFSGKLWHQATETLLEFVRDPANHRGDNIVDLWRMYIQQAGRRMHPVKYAHLTAICASKLAHSDAEAAKGMLEELVASRAIGEEADQGRMVAELELGALKLRLGDTAACKEVVEKHEPAIDSLEEADSLVAGSFHSVAAQLYRTVGPASAFHDHCLRYLALTPLSAIPAAARPSMAVDLAVSALLSETVFSFAEVLEHPISAAIGAGPGSDPRIASSGAGGEAAAGAESASSSAAGEAAPKVVDEWLAALMRAADRGAVEAVAGILASHAEDLDRHPALKASQDAFKAKVVLMALMATAAERPASERSLSFAEIADACGLPVSQVEWVVMRATAKGLIEATIDGVDEVVHVHYVRPRALGREAVGKLGTAVRGWMARTHEQLVSVEHGARDIMS